MLLFSGSSHPDFASKIALTLGVPLAPIHLGRFPDGEVAVDLPESVRGQDLFVVQTLAIDPNNYIIELLVMIDAFRRASARSITVVIPYYAYCRQDRKDKPREPISAKLIANLLVSAGAEHILVMDLHAGQLEGFFDIPVDHLQAMPLLARRFLEMTQGEPCAVVAPDVGSVRLSHTFAKYLTAELVIVDKERLTPGKTQVLSIIGDVENKNVLLADDMCSTGSTLVSAAKACREKGAKRIFAAVTHGLFMSDAISQIEKSPIEALLVSDTIPAVPGQSKSTKIKTVSVAPLFAHAIRCIASQVPVSLHQPEDRY